MYESLKNACKTFSEQLELSSSIKFVVEKNAEAVIAAALLSQLCVQKSVNFSLSFFTNLEKTLLEIEKDPSKLIFFIGNKLTIPEEKIKKPFFILTKESALHHHTLSFPCPLPLSAYVLAKMINQKAEPVLALLAFVKEGNPPEELLTDLSKRIEITSGILVGSAAQPLQKMLGYCANPFLPGISGSEDGCFSFLREMGISYKENGRFKSWTDLSQQEQQRLSEGLQLRGISKRTVFLLKEEDSELKDLSFWYETIEACITFGNPSLAVSLCLYPKKFKQKALEVFLNIRRSLITSLEWCYLGFSSGQFPEKGNILLIPTTGHIPEHLAYDFVSIVLKWYTDTKIVFFIVPSVKGVLVLCGTKNNINIQSLVPALSSSGYKGRFEKNLLVFELESEKEPLFCETVLTLGGKILSEEIVR